MLLIACGDREPPRTSALVTIPGDLSATCEGALERTAAIRPRSLNRRFRPDRVYSPEDEYAIGRVAGAEWDGTEQRLFVLDAMNSQVVILDSAGSPVGLIGRRGEGPGEISDLGREHGSRAVFNQLALLPGRALVISDFDRIHFFGIDGTFRTRIGTSGARLGPFASRHLAALSDSSVLYAQSGLMQMDAPSEQIREHLIQLVVTPDRVDTIAYGAIENQYAVLPPFKGFPPPHPYAGEYRRSWAATGGMVAIVSLRRHAICFFDDSGNIRSAYLLDAPGIPVDEAERHRVVELAQQIAIKTRLPIRNGGRDLYQAWPEFAPFYRDLVIAPDSIAWALRRRRDGNLTVDLFHPTRGYLGSTESLDGTIPIAFSSPECGLVRYETEHTYGLRRWCRV